MKGIDNAEHITVPEGWHKEALFGRLVKNGLCSYEYLSSPSTPMESVFGMLRILALDDYCEAKTVEKARRHNGC